MSRARNLAGFATAIYPVDNISVGFITCRDINITGVATFQNINISAVDYADVAGIATVAEGLTGTPNISVGTINASGTITGDVTGDVTGDLTGNADTASNLTGTPNITVGNIVAVGGTFSGDLEVQGTVTYEDVTNVDSVGVITAQQGIDVTGGDVTGNNSTNISGINSVTATEYYGDGSNLVLDYQDLTIRNWMFGPG